MLFPLGWTIFTMNLTTLRQKLPNIVDQIFGTNRHSHDLVSKMILSFARPSRHYPWPRQLLRTCLSCIKQWKISLPFCYFTKLMKLLTVKSGNATSLHENMQLSETHQEHSMSRAFHKGHETWAHQNIHEEASFCANRSSLICLTVCHGSTLLFQQGCTYNRT